MCKGRAATPAHPEILCTCPPETNYCQDCSFYELPRCKHVRVATFKGRKNTCILWTPKDSKGRWTRTDRVGYVHKSEKITWWRYSYLGDSPYTWLWRGRKRLVSILYKDIGIVMTKKEKFIEGRKKLIKSTVEEKMALYHRLCDISDFLLNKYNPCKFKDCKCDGLQKTTCCVGCPDLEDGVGCTAKALQCKLYLCYDVREGHLHETLSKLQSIASMNSLIHYRKGAEFTEEFLRYDEGGVWEGGVYTTVVT